MSDQRSDTLSTYRHLRLAMVLLLLLLFGSVGLRALTAGAGVCLEGSISAYYFTSSRAVFVAVLCAVGTCLIVYRGNTDSEDVALNASGALAFIVAFVPTDAPNTTGVRCSASNIPTPGQLDGAVNNNVVSLLVVFFVALVTAMWLLRRQPSSTEVFALRIMMAALVVGTAVFVIWPEGFRANAHATAAIGTFIGILVVVALNAVGARRTDQEPERARKYAASYTAIAVAMLISGIVLGLAHWQVNEWRHGVFFIETDLLLWFLIFWIVQTFELWNRITRDEPKVEVGQ